MIELHQLKWVMRMKNRYWRPPKLKSRSWHCRLLKLLIILTVPALLLQLLSLAISAEHDHSMQYHKTYFIDAQHLEGAEALKYDMLSADLVKRYLQDISRGSPALQVQKPYTFKEYRRIELDKYNQSYEESGGQPDSSVVFSWRPQPDTGIVQSPPLRVLDRITNTQSLENHPRRQRNSDRPIDSVRFRASQNNRNIFLAGRSGSRTQFADTEHLATQVVVRDVTSRPKPRTTSSITRHKDQETSSRPICPLNYHIKTCSMLFITDSSMKVKISPPSIISPVRDLVRRGTIAVNGRVALDWNTKDDNFFLVRLDDQCQIMEKLSFQVNTHRSRDLLSSSAAEYINNLPNKTLVVGVAYGNTNQLVRTTSYVRYKGTTPRHMCVTSFVKYRGYPGLSSRHVDSGRDYHSEESQFHFGYTFDPIIINTTYSQVVREHSDVALGGHWRPADCTARTRIALIIPFRAREAHLTLFLLNIIHFLKKQNIEHRIYVVEQTGPELFNRAALMNVGYLEAREENFDCYVFHDVDQIPEDLTNWYHCSAEPRHLMASRSYTGYQMRFAAYFGGAISLTSELIEEMNGFSNRWYGWGGEDDDMYGRLLHFNHTLQRLPLEIGRYRSLEHEKEDTTNPHLKSKHGSPMIRKEAGEYIDTDGLSTLNITSQRSVRRELYTHVYVQIPGPLTAREEQLRRWPDMPPPSATPANRAHSIFLASVNLLPVLFAYVVI